MSEEKERASLLREGKCPCHTCGGAGYLYHYDIHLPSTTDSINEVINTATTELEKKLKIKKVLERLGE